MSHAENLRIEISYDEDKFRGSLILTEPTTSTIWDRIRQFSTTTDDFEFTAISITLPWPSVLSLIREFASYQNKWGFRFKPDSIAKPRIDQFVTQYKSVQSAKSTLVTDLSIDEIERSLSLLGFSKRKLKDFQLRDLQRLLSLRNGANFSVPGAGKTTVTFALHVLTRKKGQILLVVGPKSAFPAWSEVVQECVVDEAPKWVREPFKFLTGGAKLVHEGFNSGASRFVISYDQIIAIPEVFTLFLAQNPVHLVLDESHRMKGGYSVKRGSVLLKSATLPVRRDILSGTPMPQAASDLQPQLEFLWPGCGIGVQISHATPPREVIGNLYVRTTKKDLKLPPVSYHFHQFGMGKGQSALYAIIRNETLRNMSSFRSGSGMDIIRARRSVMRLLQLSTNPVLALNSIMENADSVETGIIQQVLEEGPSPKMIAVRDFARELAAKGRKSVIWSIFTDTIEQLERMLADLNPVTIYGAIPSGDASDPSTREGRLKRFNEDTTCMAFVANPATAGEGISLHHICHDAIYLDRSYNSTHYLQSIDRIHRLGLPYDTQTNIHIFQTRAPKGIGCIDYSVSRRLAIKIRALQQLLEDEDLHRIALDEEESEEPIDYDIQLEDLIDLIDELEGREVYIEEKAV